MATPEEMEEEKVKMDQMELHDILVDIIKPDIVDYNEIQNIPYFRTRLANEPVTDELKNAAMCMLDDLSEELDNLVKVVDPTNQKERRKNLDALVSLCEEIIGV
jgi:hypothetical protein